MSKTCPVCGTVQADGAYRCEGQLEDGTRCGKDLTGDTSPSGNRTAMAGGR